MVERQALPRREQKSRATSICRSDSLAREREMRDAIRRDGRCVKYQAGRRAGRGEKGDAMMARMMMVVALLLAVSFGSAVVPAPVYGEQPFCGDGNTDA